MITTMQLDEKYTLKVEINYEEIMMNCVYPQSKAEQAMIEFVRDIHLAMEKLRTTLND